MKHFLYAGMVLIVMMGSLSRLQSKEQGKTMSSISREISDKVIQSLIAKHGDQNKFRIERGVTQAAAFWTEPDGDVKAFETFCAASFISDEKNLDALFGRLSVNLETLYGYYNKISLDLKRQIQLDQGEILPIDEIFGAFDPYAHMTDDFFQNKIAFMILLNFPHYSLKEKSELGTSWTRKQWAYARMGDVFTSRIPASIAQKMADALTVSDSYISQYYIYMGKLVDNKNQTLFPADMKLISHWNLRDELKSRYADKEGLPKQQMIYEVMKRIINQDIPKAVINSKDMEWNPYQNKLFKGGKEVKVKSEPDNRFWYWLNNFRVFREADAYSPYYPTTILRKFDEQTELSYDEVEKLFTDLLSSKQVRKVGAVIGKRLKRKMEPFDIWYDGFKTRSTINEDDLSKLTREKYPNAEAFAGDMANILVKLGFDKNKAAVIASKIEVDPSRGAGHASGSETKFEKSHLRTRIGPGGMDYKGYNIAVHEFGHNVEQTITLQDIDFYMLRGVPTTAFTEAIAFNFQKRDLELLGMKDDNPNKKHLQAMDNLWSTYEIMGVALLDMRVWKWLYANPNADEEQLKQQVIKTAKEIWNQYYSDVFDVKDQPILAIYSHMIDSPIYLPAYPLGHLIEFQIDSYFEGKNLAQEMQRMILNGRVLPQVWMKNSVGKEISIEPMLKAADEAFLVIK